MSRTALLDTNVLVYLSQPESEFFEAAARCVVRLKASGYKLVVSSFAVAEYYSYSKDLSVSVTELFEEGEISELAFGHAEALEFASLRKKTTLRIPPIDAVHIATARVNNIGMFLTNDQKLHRLKLPGLKIKGF